MTETVKFLYKSFYMARGTVFFGRFFSHQTDIFVFFTKKGAALALFPHKFWLKKLHVTFNLGKNLHRHLHGSATSIAVAEVMATSRRTEAKTEAGTVGAWLSTLGSCPPKKRNHTPPLKRKRTNHQLGPHCW